MKKPVKILDVSRAIFFSLMILFCLPTIAQKPQVKNYNSQLATDWFTLQLRLIRTTPGFSPPVASRALGYAGLTLYESLVNGMPEYQSLAGILNEFKGTPKPELGKEYHWILVANTAQANITKSLYGNTSKENLISVDSLAGVYSRRYQNDIDKETLTRSIKYGEAISRKILRLRLGRVSGHPQPKECKPCNLIGARTELL
ncbi:MAG: hypothetical protein MUF45_08280 [Spirosomaceae bacterium]|nr:hypothetical protein [Spirosomataceae bacterium]